ncbi:MAG: hypothetical protein U0529_03205 [Thermoanaerobaculia bacterium]
MSRIASRSIAAAAAFVLLAASGAVLASIVPAPVAGPGTWSAAHPIWFDLNGDGVPQSNELTGFPTYDGEGCTKVVGYPAVLGATESPCATVMVYMGVSGFMDRPDGMSFNLSSNDAGTQFTFSEYRLSQPTKAGSPRTLAASAGGTGTLLDQNHDGINDTLQVEGATPSHTVPQTLISLVPIDVTGDGRPDYISMPWTPSQVGLLGVDTGSTPQFYIPLTDTNGDGWPDTVTVQVANGGVSTTTGPPVSGPALAFATAIPSLSTIGLFVFAAAIVVFGVKLLRGSVLAA